MRTAENELSYTGPAVVSSVAAQNYVFTDTLTELELLEHPGVPLRLHFRQHGTAALPVLGELLTLGRSLQVTAMAGGEENLTHALVVIRDTDDQLLLAHHSGADNLHQAGHFDTPDLCEFSLTLTPLCRSSVSEGCFEHQTQAEYSGTFSAESELLLETYEKGQLRIAGGDFAVTFAATSVDGGRPICTGVSYPGRYVDFTVVPASH